MKLTPFRIQPRDTALWQEIDEVGGYIDTCIARERHWKDASTDEACLRRLRLYAAHDITRTVQLSVCLDDGRRGRPPMIHCLTPRGGELLAEITGVAARHVHRRDPKPEMILHRLGVARVQLIVKDACIHARLPRPYCILEQDMHGGVAPGAPLTQRFVLYEAWATPDGEHVTCRPDASSWLRIPAQGNTTAADLLVYWEYDRSTQVLQRIARRVEGYRLLHATGAFRAHWPQAENPTVRVFFVAQSNDRLNNVANIIRDLPGSELFRLTTVAELSPEHFFTQPIWQTAQRERRSILHAPVPIPAARLILPS